MLAGHRTIGGERVVGLERGERLHRLAEPLLVGDERPPALERVAHAGALEGVQLAAELEAVELGVLGVGERDRGRRAVVLGDQLVEQLARRARRRATLGCVGDEAVQVSASAGSAGTAMPHARGAVEEAAVASATGCASGRRLKSRAGAGSQIVTRSAPARRRRRSRAPARPAPACSPPRSSRAQRAREVVQLERPRARRSARRCRSRRAAPARSSVTTDAPSRSAGARRRACA